MTKVKFLNTVFEGNRIYTRGEEAVISDDRAKAFAKMQLVQILHKLQDETPQKKKAYAKPPKNKMVDEDKMSKEGKVK